MKSACVVPCAGPLLRRDVGEQLRPRQLALPAHGTYLRVVLCSLQTGGFLPTRISRYYRPHFGNEREARRARDSRWAPRTVLLPPNVRFAPFSHVVLSVVPGRPASLNNVLIRLRCLGVFRAAVWHAVAPQPQLALPLGRPPAVGGRRLSSLLN